MDWAAFGLARDPFQRGAELDDACLPNTVSALLSELLSSLRSPQGVSVLIGESGSGKSMAAAAFARRAGGSAYVAYIAEPTSSVAAIARDALAQFDPSDFDFSTEEDWIPALRARVERCTRAGRTSVLILDDAHRLSPQTLHDLAEYFAEDDTLKLHVFLFGRPKLLDRLQSGAEEALSAHLLQICRLDPLGVRESVRYLERRIAICGGELAAILSDEAIDEIVQKAEGCVIRLEELAVEALQRASGKGVTRATVVDVVATARTAAADEEDVVMGSSQQPLRFAIEEEQVEEDEVTWGDEEDDRSLEWSDEPDADEEEEWHASEEEEEDDSMAWDAAPSRGALAHEEEFDEDDSDEEDDEPRRAPAARSASPSRRRLLGPAVLSLGACFALVWAANQMPGPDETEKHGRDAVMFAERLSSEPKQIMRLASTREAADADAHVKLWNAQPPRPVPAAEPVAVAKAEPATPEPGAAVVATASAKPAPQPEQAFVGPMPQRPIEVAYAPAAPVAKQPQIATKKPVAAPVEKAGTPARAATKQVASAKKKSEPAYTVQVGAFKARRNADEMVAKLRGKSPRILEEGGFYRVMSGSFASKREAAVHEASLKRAGYTTYVRTAIF